MEARRDKDSTARHHADAPSSEEDGAVHAARLRDARAAVLKPPVPTRAESPPYYPTSPDFSPTSPQNPTKGVLGRPPSNAALTPSPTTTALHAPEAQHATVRTARRGEWASNTTAAAAAPRAALLPAVPRRSTFSRISRAVASHRNSAVTSLRSGSDVAGPTRPSPTPALLPPPRRQGTSRPLRPPWPRSS